MEHHNNTTQEVVIKVNIPMAPSSTTGGNMDNHPNYDHNNHDQHNQHNQHNQNKKDDSTMDAIISQRRKSIHEEVDALHGNVKFDQRSETLKEHLNLEEHPLHNPEPSSHPQQPPQADATFEDQREDEMQQLEEQHAVTNILQSEVYRDHLENSMGQRESAEEQRRSSRPSSSSSSHSSKKSEHLLMTNGNLDKPHSNSRENSMSKFTTHSTTAYHQQHEEDHHEPLSSTKVIAAPERRTSQTVEHKFYQAAMTTFEDPLKETSPRPSLYESTPVTPNTKGDSFMHHPAASTSAGGRSKKQKSTSCSIL